jgi:hypothetical protein
MPRVRFSVTDIIKYLLESEKLYFDVTLFSYDYSTKQILYEGYVLDVKVEAIDFALKTERNLRWQDFRDAVYYFAKMNTPKPEKPPDIVTEYVARWLEQNKPEKITTLELIEKAFAHKPVALTQRSLETRVGRALRELGWIRKKTATHRYWFPPAEKITQNIENDTSFDDGKSDNSSSHS